MPYDINGRPIDKKLDNEHLFGNNGCFTAIVIFMCVAVALFITSIVLGIF